MTRYWFNEITKVSSWTKPDEAANQTLERHESEHHMLEDHQHPAFQQAHASDKTTFFSSITPGKHGDRESVDDAWYAQRHKQMQRGHLASIAAKGDAVAHHKGKAGRAKHDFRAGVALSRGESNVTQIVPARRNLTDILKARSSAMSSSQATMIVPPSSASISRTASVSSTATITVADAVAGRAPFYSSVTKGRHKTRRDSMKAHASSGLRRKSSYARMVGAAKAQETKAALTAQAESAGGWNTVDTWIKVPVATTGTT